MQYKYSTMKKLILSALLANISFMGFAQDQNDGEQKESKSIFQRVNDNLSGSLEINSQWYNDDRALGPFQETANAKDPKGWYHLRQNSYLRLDYNFLERFTVGIQAESYEKKSLLNYSPDYEGTNLAQYFANYRSKNNRLDVTAGYFFEQFGSGVLLRSFEERQLGLNNALRGGRIKLTPVDGIDLTGLYGRMRIGLHEELWEARVGKGDVYGFDATFDVTTLAKIDKIPALSLGFSYVGKYETPDALSQGIPGRIDGYSTRLDVDFGRVYASAEYSTKDNERGLKNFQPIQNKGFDGNSLILTAGYVQKGLGFTGTLRRLENMTFFAERSYQLPAENTFNMLSMNYLPTLTKQHDYLLTNIYVYNTQAGLNINDTQGQAGEISFQFDFYYSFRKGWLGKKKTKITANYSYAALLDAAFDEQQEVYKAPFTLFGKRTFRQKAFRDFNIEVRNKWSRKVKTAVSYYGINIDKDLQYGSPLRVEEKYINSHILVGEATVKLGKKMSVRAEAQHLWNENAGVAIKPKDVQGNWWAGTLEVNLTRNISIYGADMYNYANNDVNRRIHYYNVGGSYTKGATRFALNYGKQRDGLFCVGGVCRQVSANSGLTVNITTSF